MDKIKNTQGITLMNNGYAIRQLQTQTVTPVSAKIPSPTQRRTWRHGPRPVETAREIKPKPENPPRKELDGFVMLEAARMGFPEDARRAVVSGRGFNAVVAEDMNFFVNLTYLDVSDNLFDFRDFEDLQSLCELRLSCNYIEQIFTVEGYLNLEYLDLSYNRLSGESVLALASLPQLRDLDLTGNELMTLPANMNTFKTLERLVLEHNKLDDNNIFFELCQMMQLREVCLAYNLLSYVPSQACSEGYFPILEFMDLSYNFIASQSAIEPCIECPRLLKLLVYGNPLLGSTGEDPLGTYVEELFDSAMLARDGHALPPLDIITEAPQKRTLRKGGFIKGRHSMYKEFSIEAVDSEQQTLKKTSRQYKMEGNKTLFAQAVDVARRSITTAPPTEDFDDASAVNSGFFLTSMHTDAKKQSLAGASRTDRVADEVMAEIAGNMDLNNSSDIRQLRNKMGAKYRTSEEKEEDENESERVPHDLFSRSMTNPDTLQTYPVSLNTAIKSLRFAIQHPLTNHDEVPASALFPAKHYNQKTILSEGRQLPRLEGGVPVKITDVDEKLRRNRQKKRDAEAVAKSKNEQTGKKSNQKKEQHAKPASRSSKVTFSKQSKPFLETVNDKKKIYANDKRAQTNTALMSTMQQIDDVLDGLNKNTLELSMRHGNPSSHDGNVIKNTGRPSTAVKGLIDMVNNVVDELGK
mmetsp:Transcript_3975/g.6748  ORF Transcript_3975/g.6748 Transcript_3975/m.6748 type:complete len:694 (+) Transcript_3975:171-2252(+)